MKIIKKNVYYCGFCKKHNLSGGFISQHEKHCTANPNRTCRMCDNQKPVDKELIKFVEDAYSKIIVPNKTKAGINYQLILKFQKEISNLTDCPACLLAIYRQSKFDRDYFSFNYRDAVQKYWKEKEDEENLRDLYSQ